MKRASELHELSRRDFCAFACLGVALVSCTDSSSGGVETGGLDGTNGNGQAPDAGSGAVAPKDGSVTNPTDGGGVAATCTGTYTDVGAASSYAVGAPKYVSAIKMFVAKDANGFYAMTAKCPHEGVVVNNYSGGSFYCSAHGAQFDLTGTRLSGPTNKSLQHYAMCTLANGNLGVETTMTVAATVRLVA